MFNNSVEERLQHMYLERDYLRTLDNVLLNIEIINSRYHSNDFLRNNRINRHFNRSRRNNRTWNSWSNPNRNHIFSSGNTIPPPLPPLSNSFSFYTRPRTTSTNTLNDNINNFINNTLHTPSRPNFPTYNQVSSSTTTMDFSDLSNNTCTICPISRDNF